MKRLNPYSNEESEKQREVRNKISNFVWELSFFFFFLEYLVFLTHTHTGRGEGILKKFTVVYIQKGEWCNQHIQSNGSS